MRNAKTLSVSLLPDLKEQVQKLAIEERRSVSEVFREAIRQYVEKQSRKDDKKREGARLSRKGQS